MLEIRLFGRFDVRSDGVTVVPTSSRARSLLAYLVLRRDAPQGREQLAHLLWPESGEQQARTNLRHVLHTVRGTVPGVDRHLHATAGTICWRGGWDDVSAFEAAAGEESIPALREAAALHSAELLEGWDDDWIVPERERLRRTALTALVRLRMLLEAHGELDEAIACGERALVADRFDEETYRALMRLHEARGDRARAVRMYHECAAALEDELGWSRRRRPARCTRRCSPGPVRRRGRRVSRRSSAVGTSGPG